jgi:hypothetical protein
MRITESVAPPGAKGTMTRTGFDGNCWACAAPAPMSAMSNSMPRGARQVTPDAMLYFLPLEVLIGAERDASAVMRWASSRAVRDVAAFPRAWCS